MLDLAFLKPRLVQWSRSFEQDPPKTTPSPWGIHCPLRVNHSLGSHNTAMDEIYIFLANEVKGLCDGGL